MDLVIQARELYSPLERIERPIVLIEDGLVADVRSAESSEIPRHQQAVDLGDAILVPGYIDMHIHGGAGHDVMETGTDALPAVEHLLCAHGVTQYFPTTVTAPVDRTLAALEHLADAIEKAPTSANGRRARPVGIHLEGPFISHVRPGVHPPADLLPPTLEMFEKFWQASRGTIKVMTIAPELDGARALIAEASRRGVCVSMGHSDADLQQAQAGVAAGVRHATHTFNAMRPLEHRDPGIVGEALMDERLSAEIIADGIHVDPLVVDLFLRARGQAAAVLVTDATAATGMPNGRYRLGSLEVEVKDGKCLRDGRLAGSVLTMDKAVRNVVKFANWNLQQAVRLATLNPARTTGLPSNAGMLVPGAVADIVALSPAGDVLKTIVRGRAA
jgi:N-acetylglucosamine-6-phosphate deacetylase